MTSEALLARIDSKLDRIVADRERWEREYAEGERRWEGRDRDLKRLREEDQRFHRELLERHARISQDQLVALAALQDEIAEQRMENKAEAQAQREALMRMIDRLPPPHQQG